MVEYIIAAFLFNSIITDVDILAYQLLGNLVHQFTSDD